MAISDRVREAIDSLQGNDPINGLIQVSIAIDATAKKVHPARKVGDRCKLFLRERQAFITRVATGLLEIRGDLVYTFPSDPRGYKTQEEVLYHLVRCSLLHEGELSHQVKIIREPHVGMTDDGRVLLGIPFIWAMILAVIGSSVNRSQTLPDGYTASIGKLTFRLNDFWGKGDRLYELVKQHNPEAAPPTPP